MKYLLLLISFLLSPLISYADRITVIPESDDYLSKKFQQGTLELYDIPKYIVYLSQKSVAIAGILGIIFVMIGGYLYLTGSFTESSDKGKQTILNVIWGLAFVSFAWMIIDIIIRLVTD